MLAFVLLIGFSTCIFQVNTEEVGVLQRFGHYQETVQPGLHFKLPFGIDQVTAVPVLRQLKLEFGFPVTSGATNSDQTSREPEAERNMVTGDLNAAQVEWVVQYGISDPKEYLFKLRDPGSTLRDISESIMREVVGDRTVDEVLTIGHQEIENETIKKLKVAVENLKMGLRVEQVQLKGVHPPGPVQSSFDDVNSAQQEKGRMVNVAIGETNKVVPRAEGEAAQKISEAEGYAVKRKNEAEGDVARFKAMLEQYEKAPDVTRQRIYLETMSEVIPQLGQKIILDDAAKQFLPLMQIQSAISAKTPLPVRR